MNLIQALRLPNSRAVMTNIARFHYQNIYNVGLTLPIVTQSNLTFQIKGYTRNYRFLSIIGKTRCDEVQNQMRLLEG